MSDAGRSDGRGFGQIVAGWVVARPQNAVLALTASLALPLLQLAAGALVVLLVLERGVRDAAIFASIAVALLVGVTALAQVSAAPFAINAFVVLLPSLLFGLLLQWTRSLTLTLQLSVLLAVLAVLGFAIAVKDPVAYWAPVMEMLVEWARTNDLHMQAEALTAEPVMAANMMTLAFVLTRWTLLAIIVLFGYGLARSLDGRAGDLGRFSDLSFGRVLALALAIASVVAWLLDAAWLQNVALVLFATFWLQGLAVVHFLYNNGQLPTFVVVTTYGLMLVLHVFLLLALAVFGYTDAWFDYRRRAAGQRNDSDKQL